MSEKNEDDGPQPPDHLSPEAAEWWRSVEDQFRLDDHHLRLLSLCCEAWDRCQQARQALAEHGTTFTDRFGQPRSRPEVAIERDSRAAFVRTLRELGLDLPAVREPRPPRHGTGYMS